MKMDETKKGHKIFSGSTLKIIAMAVMLIDHIAAALPDFVCSIGIEAGLEYGTVYGIMRGIGRTAFPIFCFLLVEGFFHTRSKAKYMRNMFLFALISEIPFDLAIFGEIGMGYQSVYFTLLLGLIMIWIFEQFKGGHGMGRVVRIFMMTLTFLLICIQAEYLHTDYGAVGIVLIAILYFFRKRRVLAGICGYLWLYRMERWCFPAFLLIQCYNGKRGLKLKYVFYFFYPAHLLALWAVRAWLIG